MVVVGFADYAWDWAVGAEILVESTIQAAERIDDVAVVVVFAAERFEIAWVVEA